MLPARYLLKELGGADLEDFEIHMMECSICFEQVQAGQAFTQALAAGVSAPPRSIFMQCWQRIKEWWNK